MKPPYRCPEAESLERLIGEAFEAMPGPDTIRLGKIGGHLEAGLRRHRWREFLARWWWLGLLAAGGATAAWWASRPPGPESELSETAPPVVITDRQGNPARTAPSRQESDANRNDSMDTTPPQEQASPIIDRRERY